MKSQLFQLFAKTLAAIIVCITQFLLAEPTSAETKSPSSDEAIMRKALAETQFGKNEKFVVVYLTEQKVALLETDNLGVVIESPLQELDCNSGKESGTGALSDFPTPTTIKPDGTLGYCKVLKKEVDGKSTQYGGVPMPYCLRLDIKDGHGNIRGICIHEGPLRGYSSSHGCIRLAKGDAKKLFDQVTKGTKVFILGSAKEADKSRGFVPSDLLTYRSVNGKKVPMFKVASPDHTEEDLALFRKAFLEKKLSIDYLDDDGDISLDKSVIQFRFESTITPHGTGISVTHVEKLLGVTVRLRPPEVPDWVRRTRRR